MAARPVDGSARALREREVRSLKFLILVTFAGFVCEGVILVAQVLILPAERVQATGLVVFMAVNVTLMGVLFYALHRAKWVSQVGLVIAIGSSTFAATAAYTL